MINWKLFWCNRGFHNWEYNDLFDKRTCKDCGKKQMYNKLSETIVIEPTWTSVDEKK